MIIIKSDQEVDLMRESGKVTGFILKELENFIKPGISTADINGFVEDTIRKNGMIPTFKGYCGFPASACVSINEEVVHGIPKKEVILKDGDIISLDAGLIYKGYHSDAARTHLVGNVSDEVKQLVEVTKQAFFEGIKYAKQGYHLHDISNAIDDYVSQFGYGIVRALVGHGIGTSLHEDPQIPNYRQKRRGVLLRAGMTLAIEPMINLGTWDVEFLDDDWTVVSKDNSPSAHYENTVLITESEPEILTLGNF